MTSLAIETRGLIRKFSAQVAVNRMELRVPKGSIYGFLGPNGAGKTTTIRMLLGLLNPTGGEVLLHGEQLTRRKRTLLLRSVGALVETPSLYPHLTAEENLEVARKILDVPRSRVQETLALVDLLSEATRPVHGYSLGMKQRLGLALAWLGEPSLLILDEPTNGLDPAGARDIRQILTRLTTEHQATIFLSSHILSEVEQIANGIGIIDHGRLLYQGTLQDLFEAESTVTVEVDRYETAMSVLKTNAWDVWHHKDGMVSVRITSAKDAASINRTLVEHGVGVYSLGLNRNTLETAYLRFIPHAQRGAE